MISMRGPAPEVLLMTTCPAAHAGLIRTLRGKGVRVRVARRADRGVELLDVAPVMVLIDLANSVGLDRGAVERLNRSRGRSIVVALHQGDLRDVVGEMEDLSVDGFCRTDRWQPIAGMAGLAAHAPSAAMH